MRLINYCKVMNFQLEKLCEWLNAPINFADVDCHSIAIDSRVIEPGALFIAIAGERFDGHDFVSQAEEKGANAVIVEKPVNTLLPAICVKDTRAALGQIAKKWREQWSLPVICITGSCGKTTSKTMMANILQHLGGGIATLGTLNNDIGLPLTVFGLTEEHRYAVFELGANHLGEIAYLADIARPTVAVITNAAGAHLEGFGSIDGVARAKSEIYQALSPDGVAVLNSDDHYAEFWRKVIGERRRITFSSQRSDADFYAKAIRLDDEGCAEFILVTPVGNISVHLPLIGQHHVANALAAAAACFAVYSQVKFASEMNQFLPDVQKGLETLSPLNKRLVAKKAFNGAKILDDSYNANPLSLSAALEVLAHYSGEKILVLGDMGELGVDAQKYHEEAGCQAKKLGINALYAVGEFSRSAVKAFGESGKHFDSKQKLIATVIDNLTQDMVILVKGSRSAKMEEIVAALTEN